jgi:plasmid stabilization system protein ParE
VSNLSPAAQAVLDAAGCHVYYPAHRKALAAALRAAADQVVPHPGRYPMNEYMEGLRDCKQDFYAALRGIADELERQ